MLAAVFHSKRILIHRASVNSARGMSHRSYESYTFQSTIKPETNTALAELEEVTV